MKIYLAIVVTILTLNSFQIVTSLHHLEVIFGR